MIRLLMNLRKTSGTEVLLRSDDGRCQSGGLNANGMRRERLVWRCQPARTLGIANIFGQ